MSASSQFVPASLSLGAVVLWGTSDFTGGFAVRNADAFLFTTIANGAGTILMLSLALLHRSALPSAASIEWALSAGLVSGIALAIFYRALAAGKMGLTAPLTAVLSAAIPAAISMITEGLPRALSIAGFVLAGAGIWLISRSDGESRPEGLGMALLAGIGFAAYYLCTRQAGSGSVLWIAALSRLGSLVATAVPLFIVRKARVVTPTGIRLGVMAGCIDVVGSVFFIRACQTGRLDTAVVISSLYPAITVLLARVLLKERLTTWRTVGMFAALAAVPLIALQ